MIKKTFRVMHCLDGFHVYYTMCVYHPCFPDLNRFNRFKEKKCVCIYIYILYNLTRCKPIREC